MEKRREGGRKQDKGKGNKIIGTKRKITSKAHSPWDLILSVLGHQGLQSTSSLLCPHFSF